MTQEISLWVKCPQCHGTRFFTPVAEPDGSGPIPCTWPNCEEGNGFLLYGKLPYDPGLDEVKNDILDKCNDILTKCNDILERL